MYYIMILLTSNLVANDLCEKFMHRIIIGIACYFAVAFILFQCMHNLYDIGCCLLILLVIDCGFIFNWFRKCQTNLESDHMEIPPDMKKSRRKPSVMSEVDDIKLAHCSDAF